MTAPHPSRKACEITFKFVPGGPEAMTNGFGSFRPSTVVASVGMMYPFPSNLIDSTTTFETNFKPQIARRGHFVPAFAHFPSLAPFLPAHSVTRNYRGKESPSPEGQRRFTPRLPGAYLFSVRNSAHRPRNESRSDLKKVAPTVESHTPAPRPSLRDEETSIRATPALKGGLFRCAPPGRLRQATLNRYRGTASPRRWLTLQPRLIA